MKRRRFRILVGIVIVGVVGTIAWRARRASGPVYEGESLAVWARRLPGGENDHTGIFWHPLFSQGIAGETKAEQAIRAMGTNTLPFLLRTMHTKDSTLSVRFNRLMWWARSRFSRQRIDYSSTLSAVQRRRWDAALALHALGPLAKSA
ncbi:MAG: hypothetical protein JWR69_935, partial [Pedosphaera sp.]|nr:hypothetical protein [Pedosphaera sp.]